VNSAALGGRIARRPSCGSSARSWPTAHTPPSKDWRDAVDHFAFNVGQGTSVLTNAHTDAGDVFSPPECSSFGTPSR
jgi:hypothetical protein